MKFHPSFLGAVCGALVCAISRTTALGVFVASMLAERAVEKGPIAWNAESVVFLIVAHVPTFIVGIGIGAITGLMGNPRIAVPLGAVLSVATFAAWAHGPIVWWVLDIKFNWVLGSYFAIAGALGAGAGSFVGLSRRDKHE